VVSHQHKTRWLKGEKLIKSSRKQNGMRLTEKDLQFLKRLKKLIDEENLAIELREEGTKRLVLRRNYGSHIESVFGMSRQGVRWRFSRLFNQVYVSSYVSICWIESNFGTELRPKAMAIARQQVELRKKAEQANAFWSSHDRQKKE